MNQSYEDFLKSKKTRVIESGFTPTDLNPNLFDFQEYIVKRACEMGKFAIFADCGLGKTLMQLEWANQVVKQTNKPVLILAPLAVSGQTISEGVKFGIECQKYIGQDLKGIYITNYDQLKNIDCSVFSGVVLDESSILKNYSGQLKNLIIENFYQTPYKLACTATPSPNDELEIGNHSEFLNVMDAGDMCSLYFTTDKNRIGQNKYRLKKHAVKKFYQWIGSWSVVLRTPEDVGFKAKGYNLPPLNMIERQIKTEKRDNGQLFNSVSVSATDFNQELRLTKIPRLENVAEVVNASDENFIIWVKQNEEADLIKKLIPDAVEVRGSDKPIVKEKRLLGFAKGDFRVLVTKTKIAQFGLNYQNCRNQVFASLDFSFEGLYQAIRRSYRFGQKNEVNVYLITTDTMQNVAESIKTKQNKFNNMVNGIVDSISNLAEIETKQDFKIHNSSDYTLYLGDCIEVIKSEIKDDSLDYCFFSPPFSSMYVFSNLPEDLSNVSADVQFFEHLDYLIEELYRTIKPGRLVSIHMMQGTTLKGRDGFYSIKDHRGEYIRHFQKAGFYFHAENMIRKDPKTAAIRTKNHQLMHGTTKRDSSDNRPGLADYILTFKKPGENQVPIKNDIPFDLWCKIAEPVWLDIQESDVLEYRTGKGNEDERHITATQLKPIEYCILLWSNPGEVVFSPFSGVGSELYQAVKMDRKAVGIELKESYFNLSIKNIHKAVEDKNQKTLF